MTKLRRLYVILGAFFIVILAWKLFRPSQFHELSTEPRTNRPINLISSNSTSSDKRSQAPVMQRFPDALTDLQKRQLAIQAQNVPINFWGKVTDQNGTALADVRVRAEIRKWQSVIPWIPYSTFPQIETITGLDGRFTILNASGDVLTIKDLNKAGFEAESNSLRSFGYNISTNVQVTTNDPIVFRMWQSGTRAKLIEGSERFFIVPDGRTYTINLMTRKCIESSSENGDLRIWVKRAQGVTRIGQRHEWSCGVMPADGGILEVSQDYGSMTFAPESGYSTGIEHGVQANAQPWTSAFHTQCYLKSDGGRMYGRFKIDVRSFYGMANTNARVWVVYALNSDGSRVLY